VHLVPAFVGLGAPHWDSNARGAILGLTRGTKIAHIARAALESAAFQTAELVEAMAKDGVAPKRLRVDGGMARNDWFLQYMTDVLGVEVVRPKNTETTVLGAAILAAVGAGEFATMEEAASLWQLDRKFEPKMNGEKRASRLAGWKEAIVRVKTTA
jgi:glycerol kinase